MKPAGVPGHEPGKGAGKSRTKSTKPQSNVLAKGPIPHHPLIPAFSQAALLPKDRKFHERSVHTAFPLLRSLRVPRAVCTFLSAEQEVTPSVASFRKRSFTY